MDLKIVFLNGDLDEEVYMQQLEGFVVPGQKHKVCKLVESLYELKQASKQWHQKFEQVILVSRFKFNESNKCICSKFNEGKGIIIWLYVDDMLIFVTKLEQVKVNKALLSSKFDMKNMGDTNVILGTRILKNKNKIMLPQSYYIEKILNKFNHSDYILVSTPLDRK